MKLSVFRKIPTRCIVFLFLLLLFSAAPVYCDEPAKKGDNLLATIRHMEALLLRSCDKVEHLMNELIAFGRYYQLSEEERAHIYSEWSKAYIKYVSDFVVAQDKDGMAIPGKFIKRFLELKKMAEEGGVLADGPKPDMSLINLAHSKSANKYFYFDEPDSSEANKKRDLRYKLEEEYEKLVNDWNKVRDDFYKQFEDKGVMKNFANALDEKTKEGREYQKKYLDLQAELTSLALSGNYEHCLGEMQAMKYTVKGMGDNLFGPLYVQGEKNTPDSLPGMGYKFVAQKLYKPITKPDIGDFPLALHLKFNGRDYFKFERDLLETKIKAEEEETRILGFGMGKVGEFAFKTVYKLDESLAAPVLLVKYVATHPVDSTVKGANFIVGLPKAIGDINVIELNKKAGDFLWGNTFKLIDAVGEIAKDITPIAWDRFDPKPGETDEQAIERLKAKLDSTKKVKDGIEVASTLTAMVAEALLDKGITKGLGKIDDAVAAFKQETKLKSLAATVDDLQSSKKILGANVPDVPPETKKAVQDLLREQSENAKEFSRFLTGDRPLEKGVRLGDDVGKKIGVVDNAGQPVQLRAGEQLGKPGGFNTAFVDADNSNLVIRKTNQPMTREALEIADAHDRFGRQVLEREVGGSSIRVAKLEGEFYEQTSQGLVRYQKVERVSDTALDQVAKQGGSMTKGQQLALEQAHRDLNNSGYVWMDNTPKNYSFERLPGGDDRWRVVVIDPDGIYPIKGKDANVAKAFQEAVNNTPKAIADSGAEDAMQKLFAFSDKYDEAAKKYNIVNDPNAAIDWDKLKQANPKMISENDVSRLHWAPDSKRLDVPDEIAKLPDNKMVEAFDKHNFDQLLNDPDYKKLVEKQKELNQRINDITEKVEPQVRQVEKAMEDGPKPPPQPDKPSGVDKDLADKLNFLSQQTAKAINAENCALLRKQALAGSKEEWLVKAVNDCVAQGF